jgi:hypothetical protein
VGAIAIGDIPLVAIAILESQNPGILPISDALGPLVRLELVQLGADGTLALEYKALDPPGHHLLELVVHMCAHGHCEDVVELLQAALFCLWEPEENHAEGDNVQGSVEAESALGRKGSEHARESQR